ncbi:MAG TPA: hypothetical protein VKU80_17535 [Planctomycetota bacterium]|nr:hypothetical protein [Planctomycetota bacterium]
MAKISAGGATKVCSLKTESPIGYQYVFTLCSDGRVLVKSGGSGYRLFARIKSQENRTEEWLRQYLTGRHSHRIT